MPAACPNPKPNPRIRQLADQITTLSAHIDAAMYRWLELLREFDECGGWADGGATHVDNLVLLCRRHHRLVHEGGFGLSRSSGGALLFTDPEGRSLPSAPSTRSRGNVFRLSAKNSAEGLCISPANGRTLWDGGPMDESIVIHHLHRRSNAGRSAESGGDSGTALRSGV